MAKGQQIRIKLKAYDNYVVDESARKIAETVLKAEAFARVRGLKPGSVPIGFSQSSPVHRPKTGCTEHSSNALEASLRDAPSGLH